MKKEYELMMNELMGVQSPQENNRSNSKLSNQVNRPTKNKSSND